jgi:hypothetical protein
MKKTIIALSSLIFAQQAFSDEIFINDIIKTETINIVHAEYVVEHEQDSLDEGESRELNYNIEKQLMKKLCTTEYNSVFDKTVEVEVFLSNGEAYMIQELHKNCN